MNMFDSPFGRILLADDLVMQSGAAEIDCFRWNVCHGLGRKNHFHARCKQ